MDKENFLNISASIAGILGVSCLVYSVIINSTSAAVIAMVLMVIFAVCDSWAENIKDAKSPTGYKKKLSALKYIAEKRSGTSEEFINEYSVELYNCFLRCGYMHEFTDGDGETKSKRWETTKLGMRKKVEFCS